MLQGHVGAVGVPGTAVSHCHQHPDNAGREQHRFAFAQVDRILQRHQGVSQNKEDEGGNTPESTCHGAGGNGRVAAFRQCQAGDGNKGERKGPFLQH